MTQSNLPGVSEIKRLLNYFLSDNFRTAILDQIEAALGLRDVGAEFYVSPANLKAMHDGGMVIGSHTVTHPVMSKLDRAGQRREIARSFRFLDELGVTDARTYCHPYGGFHSFDRDTVELLNAFDVAWSFNVESRDIESGDLSGGRQHLPRYDCNEFPHGAAS